MRLVFLVLAAFLISGPGAAFAAGSQATGKNSSAKSASSKKSVAKPSASKSKTTAKKPVAASTKSSKKSTASASSGKQAACKPVKGKKSCAAAPATAKALSSPIAADSLEKSDGVRAGDELKARTVPDRAYAIDGQTFFHQGRRIRVEGLSASASRSATGEHAKQRLQTMLDSGSLMIEQIAIDDSGIATAQVRVNGRDLAGMLNGN